MSAPNSNSGGRRTSDLAAEKIREEVLYGGMAVFDCTHQHSGGRLITAEVRLLRLAR